MRKLILIKYSGCVKNYKKIKVFHFKDNFNNNHNDIQIQYQKIKKLDLRKYYIFCEKILKICDIKFNKQLNKLSNKKNYKRINPFKNHFHGHILKYCIMAELFCKNNIGNAYIVFEKKYFHDFAYYFFYLYLKHIKNKKILLVQLKNNITPANNSEIKKFTKEKSILFFYRFIIRLCRFVNFKYFLFLNTFKIYKKKYLFFLDRDCSLKFFYKKNFYLYNLNLKNKFFKNLGNFYSENNIKKNTIFSDFILNSVQSPDKLIHVFRKFNRVLDIKKKKIIYFKFPPTIHEFEKTLFLTLARQNNIKIINMQHGADYGYLQSFLHFTREYKFSDIFISHKFTQNDLAYIRDFYFLKNNKLPHVICSNTLVFNFFVFKLFSKNKKVNIFLPAVYSNFLENVFHSERYLYLNEIKILKKLKNLNIKLIIPFPQSASEVYINNIVKIVGSNAVYFKNFGFQNLLSIFPNHNLYAGHLSTGCFESQALNDKNNITIANTKSWITNINFKLLKKIINLKIANI